MPPLACSAPQASGHAARSLTALFPVAVKTLESTGFEIETIANGVNPIYAIKYSENEILVAVTEKRTKNEIDSYIASLQEVVNA